MKLRRLLVFTGLLLTGSRIPAAAQEFCEPLPDFCRVPVACPAPVVTECAPPVVQQYAIQEQTVMMPRTVMRRQKMQVQSFRTEQRPKVSTVYEQVPEVVNVPSQQMKMVQQVQMQSQTQMMMQAFLVNVPYQYQAQTVEKQWMDRTYEVTKQVPHEVKYKVTNQKYQILQMPGQVPMKRNVGEPTTHCETHREMKQMKTCETKRELVDVPKTVTQTASYQAVEYRMVPQTTQVATLVNVPQMQTVQNSVVQYRTVPRNVTTYETVQVPVLVDQEYEVPATEYVPMKLQNYVPVYR